MPPIVFIGTAAGALVGTRLTFVTPADVKPDDVMTAIVVCDPAVGQFDASANDLAWEFTASLAGVNATLLVARRAVLAADAVLSLVIGSVPVWCLAVLRIDRGLDVSAPLVGASLVDVNANTVFACPSRTPTTYSDLYMGIVAVTSAATAVTNPGGTTERYDAGAGGRQLEVFDLLPEAIGATGAKAGTVAANQSGIAASLLFASFPVQGPRSFSLAPVGAPGLPIRGV